MASIDQGSGSIFIRSESRITPSSPTANTDGFGGTFPVRHGWYGWPIFGDHVGGRDNGSVYEFWAEPAIPKCVCSGSAQTSSSFYLMQAYESGGGCSGNIQRIWLASGSSPDTTATQYPSRGPRCTPPGTFSSYAIVVQWMV